MKLRQLGLVEYAPTLEEMRRFTDSRDELTPDELWLLQHPPVFTQGQAGKAEHVLAPGDIPVVQVDRGGQVTYHGPGQWVIYLLVDLRRHNMGVRDLVTVIEDSMMTLLREYHIEAAALPRAPSARKRSSIGATRPASPTKIGSGAAGRPGANRRSQPAMPGDLAKA